MNKYTNKSHFTQKPDDILAACDLLTKENCVIVNNILYEKLDETNPAKHKYRFFFSCDDYDYLEDLEFQEHLDSVFSQMSEKA